MNGGTVADWQNSPSSSAKNYNLYLQNKKYKIKDIKQKRGILSPFFVL